MSRQYLETEQKALEINLNNGVYGSFAEIGAGQEVAGCFFKVGASSGTIAKSMSAYDKVVSDDIYGLEQSGRYVCESRVYKMLEHEYDLMLDRLTVERPETCFFAFADTVETLNYHKTNKGHGWLGIRFQLVPNGEPNNIVLHVEMLDNNSNLQQHAIGLLGVNLVYACYNYNHDYKLFLSSLMDNLSDRIRIDMIRFDGPQFQHVDNRLVALQLVKQGMTDVAMFDKKGDPIQASEFLYKKEVLIARGSYRPITLQTMDRLQSATTQFRGEFNRKNKGTEILTEIPLQSLMNDNEAAEEQDFVDRVSLINHLGYRVMITNCNRYKRLIDYLMAYRVSKLGLVSGARELLDLINGKYERNKDGRLLASFGEVFTRGVKVYTYPAQKEGSGELIQSENLPVPDEIRYLYKHILENNQIVDIEQVNEETLHIYSQEVLRKVIADEEGWEDLVPSRVAAFIRKQGLFGFPCERVEFEY